MPPTNDTIIITCCFLRAKHPATEIMSKTTIIGLKRGQDYGTRKNLLKCNRAEVLSGRKALRFGLRDPDTRPR